MALHERFFDPSPVSRLFLLVQQAFDAQLIQSFLHIFQKPLNFLANNQHRIFQYI
jgi:hypothetical protein